MLAVDLFPPPPATLPNRAAFQWFEMIVAEFKALEAFNGELIPLEGELTPERTARSDQLKAEWARLHERITPLVARLIEDATLTDKERQKLRNLVRVSHSYSRKDIRKLRLTWERVKAGDVIDGETLRRELDLRRRR